MKRQVIWIIAWAILLPYLSAQQVVMPEKIAAFGPIEVQKPVLLDSVNLKNSTFSDETLLSYSITFPEQNRFTTELLADTAEFFHVNKPERGMAFYLFSIYLTGDRYGKGQLTVTSPNPLEVWIDGAKKESKTQREDSLHLAGKITTNLEGFTNSERLVIKLLASAEDKADPAFKIEVKPEKADSLLTYSFNSVGTRRIDIKDILEGSGYPALRYHPVVALCCYPCVKPYLEEAAELPRYTTPIETHHSVESSNRSQLGWMPKQIFSTSRKTIRIATGLHVGPADDGGESDG